MAVNPAARFQVTPVCINAPGNCFICKSEKNGPFIITGLSHDFFKEAPDASRDGTVYICTACITDMATTLVLATMDFDAKVTEARRAGIVEGVLLGKKALDEYAGNFIDISLGIVGMPSASDDLFTAHATDYGQTKQSVEPTQPKGTKQGNVADSGKGLDDVSSNSSDGLPAGNLGD